MGSGLIVRQASGALSLAYRAIQFVELTSQSLLVGWCSLGSVSVDLNGLVGSSRRIISASSRAAASAFLCVSTSHSQTTNTRQPLASSCWLICSSRITFFENLASQNSVLDFGIVATLQPGWRCQKHPCTKTTVRCFGRTMSGFPGSFRPCRRKRNPCRWSALRRLTSGLVFSERMRDIRSDRCVGVRLSTIASRIVALTCDQFKEGQTPDYLAGCIE